MIQDILSDIGDNNNEYEKYKYSKKALDHDW